MDPIAFVACLTGLLLVILGVRTSVRRRQASLKARLLASKVLDVRVEGDWVHKRIDFTAQDQQRYGLCLGCGSSALPGHHRGSFNIFPADDAVAAEVWRCLRVGDFQQGMLLSAAGPSEIIDHEFEIIRCPSGAYYAAQFLQVRGGSPKLVHRESVDQKVAQVIHQWRELGVLTIAEQRAVVTPN